MTSLCFLRLFTIASSTGVIAFLPRSKMLWPPKTRIFTSGRMQTSVSESVEAITCLSSKDSRISLLGIWARLGRLTAGDAIEMNPPKPLLEQLVTLPDTLSVLRLQAPTAVIRHWRECLGWNRTLGELLLGVNEKWRFLTYGRTIFVSLICF